MRGKAIAAWATALALTALTAPALAQTPAQAKRFGAAQKLYDTGAYTPALAEFQALAQETGSPNAGLYVARCLRELGRLPEAYEAMSAALREATARAEKEPKYAATRNAAAADLALLEPKVGKLVVAVTNAPASLAVEVNGAPLASAKLGVPVATNIGEAVVKLSAPGAEPVERRVKVQGGATVTVAVNLSEPKASPPPVVIPSAPTAPPPDSAPPPESPGLGGARIGGIVLLGVGAAGFVTFAVTGSMANSKFNSIKEACGGVRCTDPKYADEVAGGRRLDLIANVGLGVGIAGVAAGTLMVILGGPKKPPAASALAPWIGPDGGGLTARGVF